MEENVYTPDHQIQRRRIGGGGSGDGIQSVKNCRYSAEDEGDTIKCSGQSCRSCAGSLIADCVALCCCPCAVVNILTLAFFKVPWKMGRKCLGLGKKKKIKNKKLKKKCCEEIYHDSDLGWGEMKMEEGRYGISWKEEGTSGIWTIEDEFIDNNYSARFEAEKVWLELYQIGHLGFGRVSFTGNGIQSIGKGNSGN